LDQGDDDLAAAVLERRQTETSARLCRVLVVSHACVVDVNQRPLVDLAAAPDIDLALVAPRRWRSDLRGSLTFRRLAAFDRPVFSLFPFFSGRGTLHFYAAARTVVETFQPHIVHIDEEPWSLAAWQFAVSGSRHGAKIFFHTKENILKYYPYPFAAIERRVFSLAACGVALTSEASSVLKAKGFSKPIFVIPHAVDTEQFTAREAAGLRQKLGLHGTVIGYVGRLAREKGVCDLLDVMRRVASAGAATGASFLVVGNGPLESEVRAANETGALKDRVRWLPAAPHAEVQQYYNCIDILVVPSRTTTRWKEQFGRVIIEALASGAAVIGSDSGEIPHLIDATGGGLVFPEGDVDALANAIVTLLRDPLRRRVLAESGRAVVHDRYSMPSVAAQFRDVYEWLSRTDAPSHQAMAYAVR
jgi:glycosyltransferase involved in cell wall biosynthesis